jgi:hypothetical protein
MIGPLMSNASWKRSLTERNSYLHMACRGSFCVAAAMAIVSSSESRSEHTHFGIGHIDGNAVRWLKVDMSAKLCNAMDATFAMTYAPVGGNTLNPLESSRTTPSSSSSSHFDVDAFDSICNQC